MPTVSDLTLTRRFAAENGCRIATWREGCRWPEGAAGYVIFDRANGAILAGRDRPLSLDEAYELLNDLAQERRRLAD